MSRLPDRPTHCPGCGKKLLQSEALVRNGKGPWTCEPCDGVVSSKMENTTKTAQTGEQNAK